MTQAAGSLREVRRMTGVSTYEAARRQGTSQSTLSELESRELAGGATVDRLRRAADALGYDVQVLYVKRPMRPSERLAADRDAVCELLRAAGVGHAYVFGSVARGTDTAESDLDVCVEFDHDAYPSEALILSEDISELLGVRTDVVDGAVLDQDLLQNITAHRLPLC